MMTVVYVDSVFILNGVMDYLLLLVTARLAGIPLRRRRYLLAALAGAAYAVAVFLPGMGFLSAPPVKTAAGVLMALIAYGGETRLARLTLLFFALSCALAGSVLALGLLAGGSVPVTRGVFYTDVDARVLLAAATAAYGLVRVVFRAAARSGVEGRLVPVRIAIDGKTAELTALWDSGNTLRDPVDGQPVLVVAPGSLRGILPGAAARLCTPEALGAPAELLAPLAQAAPELAPRLAPYRAVGVRGGLLVPVRSEWTQIGAQRHPGLRLALSPTVLGDGYAALWGGEVRMGGRHEHQNTAGTSCQVAGPAAG